MNPCQRFQKSIFDLIDDDLDSLRKKELKQHLEVCSDCDNLAKQLRALKTRLTNLTQQKASDEFQIILRDRIRREVAGKKRSFVPLPLLPFRKRWVPAAGLAIGMLCIIFLFVNQQDHLSLFRNSGMKTGVTQTSSENNFPDRIQYVIDEIPGAVTVSRSDERPESMPDTIPDSLLLERNRDPMRVRLTPVNF